MRVAVLADTHLPRGSRRLPEACIEAIEQADVAIHAGDFATASAYEEIAALCHGLVAVHGNVDDAELCRRLPERVEVDLDGVVVGVIHDAGPARGRLGRMRREFPEAHAVVFGHSHMPLHETGEEGFQIFNPGSPTERRRAPHRTMGMAEVARGRVRFRHVVLD